MPVYDYRCEECESVYDVYHKGKEIKEDVVCPSCGSTNHKKLMSIPAIQSGSNGSAMECSSEYCGNGDCSGACGCS